MLLCCLFYPCKGVLEFFDTNSDTSFYTGEHFMASSVQWDPTGRYVASVVSCLNYNVSVVSFLVCMRLSFSLFSFLMQHPPFRTLVLNISTYLRTLPPCTLSLTYSRVCHCRLRCRLTHLLFFLFTQTDTGYYLWTFQGKLVQKELQKNFYQLVWRPRPKSLLTKKQQVT